MVNIFVYFVLFFLSVAFMFSNHSFFSIIILIFFSFFASLLVYLNVNNSWQSCSLIILISSGILIVFACISNIVPNPKDVFNFSFLNFILILFLLFKILLDLDIVFRYDISLFFNVPYYFMNYNFNFVIIFMMLILILVLIIVVKIVIKEEGPMRVN